MKKKFFKRLVDNATCFIGMSFIAGITLPPLLINVLSLPIPIAFFLMWLALMIFVIDWANFLKKEIESFKKELESKGDE